MKRRHIWIEGVRWRQGLRPLAAALLLAIAGCAERKMGTPIAVDRDKISKPSQVPAQAPAAQADLGKWNDIWNRLETDPRSVSWVEHYEACGIKYRFRRYDELFRCLELFDRRVRHLSPRDSDAEGLARFSPVLTGWMRAGAFEELGQPDLALKWAQPAWDAVPEKYRSASWDPRTGFGVLFTSDPERDRAKQMQAIFERLAGSYSPDAEERRYRDNPAALDLSVTTIVMTLAAQRAMAFAQLGEPDKARAALADLGAWERFEIFSPKFLPLIMIPFALHDKPFRVNALLLSVGPRFALHDHAGVIQAYRDANAEATHHRHQMQLQNAFNSMMMSILDLSPTTWIGKWIDRKFVDQRVFSTALEDVSNALVYAESLARTGEAAEARQMLDTILAMAEIQQMGSLYWAALYERGLIALADGQRDQAIGLLSRSVDAIEATRSTISVEAAKIGFAGDKQAVYAALVDMYGQAGQWNHAFLVAERAKARALVDLLAQQRQVAAPSNADARVRELLASATTTDSTLGFVIDTEVSRNLSSAVASRADLAQAAPEAASLVSVPQVPVASIQARLGEDDTLIDYFRVGDTLYAFLLTKSSLTGVRLSAQGLDGEVRAFRSAIEQRSPDAAALGRPLYDQLIGPLQGQIRTSQVTVSPHGVLHYLPFVALSDADGYLLDRYGVRLVPSAGTLVYLKSERPVKVGKVLALGNPDLGDAKYDLPNAQVEAEHVAAMFPASKALVRGQATKSAVLALGSGFSILHFATHGTFNTDAPLASGLYLARGDAQDGLLTVSDLYRVRFDTDLVTLSACQTALGKVANGDDVIGLTRGFLYAGARSIVASLWQVNDAATEQLMLSFYRNLQDHPSRQALRLAQIETRARYPDPALWAAFQIVGSAD